MVSNEARAKRLAAAKRFISLHTTINGATDLTTEGCRRIFLARARYGFRTVSVYPGPYGYGEQL
jgi:hypothetical protein